MLVAIMPTYVGVPLGTEGTIYEKEKGFDWSLTIDIDPKEIEFISELKRSEASSIFHVNYNGKPRVLKVVCFCEDMYPKLVHLC
jgi:hypothetical protein